MASGPHQTLRAPRGMASAVDVGALGENLAREIVGATPGRHARLRCAPPLTSLDAVQRAGQRLAGLAWYANPRPPSEAEFAAGIFRKDRLLVLYEDAKLYAYAATLNEETLSYDLGAGVYAGLLAGIKTAGLDENQNLRSAQYREEMFLCAGDGSPIYRFYCDENDAVNFFLAGIQTPDAPTATASATAGNPSGTYTYLVTDVDEFGRESSPSDLTAEITVSSKKITVAFSWQSDNQIVAKRIYRNTDSAATWYRLTEITDKMTVSYTDDNADTDIVDYGVAPEPGENDPPGRASVVMIWKERGRLLANDRRIYDDPTDTASVNRLQISNAERPTQFASFTDPFSEATPDDLGVQLGVGDAALEELVGLHDFGSIAGLWTRTTRYGCYGNSPRTFQIRRWGEPGCVSPDSIASGPFGVSFMAHNGPYLMGTDGDFSARPIGLEIEDQFAGILGGA